MASYNRTDRISEEIKRELSRILRELKDPRIPLMLSVVKVEVTKDLRFAKAYISIMGEDTVKNNAAAALKSAAGFVRREIGGRLNLRHTPEFTFCLDDSIEYGSHINQILKEL